MSRKQIEFVLRAEFGDDADLVWQDRGPRSPLNLVLAEIDAQVGKEHALCWAYKATPELVSFPAFQPATVLYSSRYVELCGLLRAAIMGPYSGGLRQEVIERLLTTLVAELALRHGDPDFAVEAFLQSAVGQGVVLMDQDKLADLEQQPKNEAYMAVWFYGLAHEYGHLHYAADWGSFDDPLLSEGLISDEGIRSALDFALAAIDLPESQRVYGMRHALENPRGFCLGIEHLREEAIADAFAANILLASTTKIMNEVGAEFRPERYIQEMTLSRMSIFALRVCRLLAEIDARREAATEKAREAMFLPAALHVRALIQRAYLETALAALYGEPTNQHRAKWGRIIEGVESSLREAMASFNAAIDNVTRFSLVLHERECEQWEQLERFRRDVGKSSSSATYLGRQFLDLARVLRVQGKLLDGLERVLEAPTEPVEPDLRGDFVYFVPFVVGSESRRPFGLDTRHGHVVFVFLDEDALYKAFFTQSEAALRDGFSLETTPVIVSRPDKLGAALARHMPGGVRFAPIVQGTELFDSLMRELASDTIWE